MSAPASVLRCHALSDPSATILGVTATPDGQWAAACASSGHIYFNASMATKGGSSSSASSEGTSFVFNLSGLSGAAAAPTTAIAFNPKPPTGLVASLPSEGYVALTTSSTGAVVQTLIDASSSSSSASAAPSSSSLVPRGHRELTRAFETNNEVLAAAYDKSGTAFVTGGSDGVLRLYDAESGAHISTLQKTIGSRGQDTVGHNGRIFSIRFIDSMCFISAGWGSTMLLHDTRVRRAVSAFEGVQMGGDAIALLGGGLVAAASDRPTEQIQIFDIGSGREVCPSITTASNLFACAAVCDAAGGGGSAKLWAVGSQPSGLVVADVHVTAAGAASCAVTHSLQEGFGGALFGVAPLRDGTAVVGGNNGGLYRVRL